MTRMTLLSWVPMTLLLMGSGEAVVQLCRRNPVAKDLIEDGVDGIWIRSQRRPKETEGLFEALGLDWMD